MKITNSEELLKPRNCITDIDPNGRHLLWFLRDMKNNHIIYYSYSCHWSDLHKKGVIPGTDIRWNDCDWIKVAYRKNKESFNFYWRTVISIGLTTVEFRVILEDKYYHYPEP